MGVASSTASRHVWRVGVTETTQTTNRLADLPYVCVNHESVFVRHEGVDSLYVIVGGGGGGGDVTCARLRLAMDSGWEELPPPPITPSEVHSALHLAGSVAVLTRGGRLYCCGGGGWTLRAHDYPVGVTVNAGDWLVTLCEQDDVVYTAAAASGRTLTPTSHAGPGLVVGKVSLAACGPRVYISGAYLTTGALGVVEWRVGSPRCPVVGYLPPATPVRHKLLAFGDS